MARFTGFPPDALEFFVELEANNNRPWWQENKDRFDEVVRDPMRALLDQLEADHGTFHAFRMNRDVRFSRDKSPYKTAHAAMTETEGGSLLYVQISASGLFIGAGVYHPAKDQLVRFREAVAQDDTGAALESAIAAVRRARLDVGGGGEPPLKTAPRGYDKDHPRIELLRWKGCIASKDFGAPAWLHTKRAASEVDKAWQRAAPLVEWLDRHVGASQLPPD
jgi:uncharacterized protein (TIGR02453 family)